MVKESFIRKDLFGYPFNGRFMPADSCDTNLYHGYATPAQECLFYDFAVLGYDLKIAYHGVYYYFMVDKHCVWLSDENFSAMRKRYENGNDVLLNFCIDDKPLYKLVDELDYFEPM